MSYNGFEIAIVGMSGRFPGSKNVAELWANLCKGKNLISSFSKDELLENGVPEEHLEDSNYVKSRGVLGDIDKFDADLFGFYPKEVEVLDPQQRLFLECCWEAMEDAGYCPDNYPGLAGIFGGIGLNTYVLQALPASGDLKVSAEAYQLSIANDKDFLTTRVSYKLNMKGPSLNVQTACSTSLVATHLACMNLLNYQCDLALAGGCTINIPEMMGYHYQEGMILSPDGYCRPFDKDANGTVASNGCGVVVLKRLEDAISDNDEIYAIIKGSAYNNDGSVKVGYTAPGVQGQSEVLSSAYSMADIDLNTIGYIETHGTGTSLGDPIEIDALKQLFSSTEFNPNSCAIGSVKSNLGHLDTAAGVAGLIKAALSVYHGKIPASINFRSPNNKIDFTNTPFFVNTELKEWETKDHPRRAGVSSFGIGGTNVHVVLEQPPLKEKIEEKEEYRLIPFSAKTEKSLMGSIESFANYLNHSNDSLRDIAYTLQTGRKEFDLRYFIVARNIQGLNEKLNKSQIKNRPNIIKSDKPNMVFMFSGQGSQYINMCKDLYEFDNTFKKYADNCFEIILQEKNLDLKALIYPRSDDDQENNDKLNQTIYTQPALFVIEYSLARTLIDYGIVPDIMVGHSIGEFVAACISGVLDLNSALTVVCMRGELMQKLNRGSMLSVNLSENDLNEIIPESIDLAVINSPTMCVVSGEDNEIDNFEETLNQKKISNTRLRTSHAFHSKMMDPILPEFRAFMNGIDLKSPNIPYMSNVTGDLISENEATDPEYYVNHLRYSVRYLDNMKNLMIDESSIFLEVGPGSTLSSLTKMNATHSDQIVTNSVRHRNQTIDDREMLLSAIGYLWTAGANLDWMKFNAKGNRIHLPTYSFDRKRYWMITDSNSTKVRRNDNYYYESHWLRKEIEKEKQISENLKWLIFDDGDNSFSNHIRNTRAEDNVITVLIGSEFERKDLNNYSIRVNSEEDYHQLLESVNKDGMNITNIIHSWNLGSHENDTAKLTITGFFSIVNLAKAIQKGQSQIKITMDVVTSHLYDIVGDEELIPEKSTILGSIKTVNQELDNLTCRLVDLDLRNKGDLHGYLNQLTKHFLSAENEVGIAFRGRYRWIQSFFEKKEFGEISENLIKENGTYVITGGLGRIGLSFAQYLCEIKNINLFLLDQSTLPDRENWDNLLSSENKDKDYFRVKKISEFENKSYNVNILQSDVGDFESLQKTLSDISGKTGKINGIIHAAGSLGDDMIKMIGVINEENFNLQLKTKITATKNIEILSRDLEPDFVILQSSLSSLLGGLGFANYSAANCFLDAFSRLQKRKGNIKTKWININWDGWNFDENESSTAQRLNMAITPSLGIKIFSNILKNPNQDQWIISLDDLNERIDKWLLNKNNGIQDLTSENKDIYHERPNITTEYVAPTSKVETEIQDEWIKLLGIKEIGINDDFFEIGGNSLIGTQLVSRLRQKFDVDIPLNAVFENASIKGIAEIINSNEASSADDINDVLDLVANMDDEKVKNLLKTKNSP